MKSWLQDNDIEMHSTNNEGKSIAAERFIRTFKNLFEKALYEVEVSGLQLSFSIALNLPYNKSKLYKTLDY